MNDQARMHIDMPSDGMSAGGEREREIDRTRQADGE